MDWKENWKQRGILFIQLLVITGFLWHFNIEEAFNLPQLFPLITLAILVNMIIPMQWRKFFGVCATIGVLFSILQPLQVLFLLGFSILLVGVCNFPIQLWLRKLIILLIAGALVFVVAGLWEVPLLNSSMLVILASMFMFRMILFLHELKYQKKQLSFINQLGYFLLLPNVIFPLFPVIDFKLYRDNYYHKPAIETYQRGMELVAKGVLHLFIYRLIYSFLLPQLNEINSALDTLTYLVLAYLLTIRLSGIFHFSVGILCLLGYDLPDVFRNHFAASGFSDLWRRINVYWKDFIVKLYFNPLYFKLKKYGAKQAVFWSTLISFIITLLLHDYQFFWLTGVFEVDVTDVVFWGFFGLIIAFASLIPKRGRGELSFAKTSFKQAVRICSTFLLMSALWSIWSSDGLVDWVWLIKPLATEDVNELLNVALILVLLVLLLWLVNYMLLVKKRYTIADVSLSVKYSIITMILLVLAFNSVTLRAFWNGKLHGEDIQALFHFTLNPDDKEDQLAGYYDDALGQNNLISPIANRYNDNVISELFRQEIHSKNILVETGDARYKALAPSVKEEVAGIEVSVNQWGMRDNEVSKTTDKNLYRVALAGASVETGWAVAKEDSFEGQIETRLNNQGQGVEILNFSVPGRLLINTASAIEPEVFPFKPDLLLVFYHPNVGWIHLKKRLGEYDYSKEFGGIISELYESYDLMSSTPYQRNRLLDPYQEEVFKYLFQNIQLAAKEAEVELVLVNMPDFSFRSWDQEDQNHQLAQQAGIEVLDLAKYLDRTKVEDFAIDFSGHPNLEGHLMIAEYLYPFILQKIDAEK